MTATLSSHNSAYMRFNFKICMVAMLAITACQKGENNAKPTDGAPKKLHVALLTPGAISDRSWSGIAYDGLKTLRDSLGAEISNIQTKTPAQFEENFRQYGAQHFDLVIGHGFEYQDAAARVAPTYPNTIYIVTSGRVTGPNLGGVSFAFEESSYQAGIIAGAMTRTNTIGLIAGEEQPPVKASFAAFALGARSINPKVKVLTSYIGSWEDVSAAKEQALAQIAQGADILFQNADAAGLGVFQAAKEKKVLAFGTNSNQNNIAPDVVVASVVIDLSKAFLLIAREVQSGQFKGHVFNLGVQQDVVRLVLNPAMVARIPANAIAAADSVGVLLRAGTFRALDALLNGADAARPITP